MARDASRFNRERGFGKRIGWVEDGWGNRQDGAGRIPFQKGGEV